MDSPTEKLNENLVGAHQTDEIKRERALNPRCWSWTEVEMFLQRNEPWSWIAIPCKGMSGCEILTLEEAKVAQLCDSLGPEKLEVFVGLVNYLRVLDWGVCFASGNGKGAAANSSA